jgi:3'(2'), 5'-bisphosphate nucleotidase
MNSLLEIAIKAALEAGKTILDIYSSEDFGIETKEDNSPLTRADLASNEVISTYLNQTGIPILSEEGKSLSYALRSTYSQLWIVDPIDGTKEFIKRNGEFTVNIALTENGKPILGVIFVPVLKELYFASSDGSFKCSNIDDSIELAELSAHAQRLPLKSDNRKFTVVASRSHMNKETEDFIKSLENEKGEVTTISKGSSLKLCLVAEGSADCYPRFAPTMEWDIAAGHAICKFSDASVIDYQTKEEVVYNREELRNNWFIVSRN